MIYHLLYFLREIFTDKIGFYAYKNVMFRSLAALLTSFAIVMFVGPKIIRWLISKKIGDRPEFYHETINELAKGKTDTPTMGGLLILAAVLGSTLLWIKLNNPFFQGALVLMLWFGILGGVDDWLKLTSKTKARSRDGLRAWEKLVFQLGGSLLLAVYLNKNFQNIDDAKMLWLPFYKNGIPIAGFVFIFISTFYISATSNAVNFADGMDGLAAGLIGIACFMLAILCYVASEAMTKVPTEQTWAMYLLLPYVTEAGELCIFYSAILGAILGFLWFNCHPAKVFMGDVGSLPLGAAMGYGAVVTRNEILLLIIGGVFVIELFSVIIQVGYFKMSGGKRVFRMAPIHHHFHLKGWSEPQVVVRFWIMAAAFAAIAMATLKLR